MIGHVSIDLVALRANVAALRALCAPAHYAAVVKADAYGHGLAAVGAALRDTVDAFCVYHVAEALTLRAVAPDVPILIVGPVAPDELPSAHAARAAIALWDGGAYLRDVERVARASGSPFLVHAKIDTGLTRLGMSVARAPARLAAYLTSPTLDLRGVYTHLAAAEELASGFTQTQFAGLMEATSTVRAALVERGAWIHAAASAAALLFPELRLDCIRAGIATYGLWPSAQTRAACEHALVLRPAFSWHSRLVVVRDVPQGQPVGYGCAFRMPHAGRIGVVPIGYAEGVPRAASDKGAVLICGTRAPIVGRVCMNMFFCDITAIPQAHTGSAVTLIGTDGAQTLSADDWADWCETINYEIVTRVPAVVPRHYDAAGTLLT